jgi:hypothetical protein
LLRMGSGAGARTEERVRTRGGRIEEGCCVLCVGLDEDQSDVSGLHDDLTSIWFGFVMSSWMVWLCVGPILKVRDDGGR